MHVFGKEKDPELTSSTKNHINTTLPLGVIDILFKSSEWGTRTVISIAYLQEIMVDG